MRVLLGSIAVLIAALAAGTGHAQDAPKADGIFVTVNNPITEGGISQIKSTVDTAKNAPKQNIKTVVFNFNPEGKDAATESFALAQELAKYIRSLTQNGVTTIAFVQGKTTRHTVLPAIACDELVMSSDARIGDVWSKDKPLDLDEQQYYQKIAGTARAGPVSKMFDKDVKLVTAKYKGGT
ncbi:MAG TPA: hypothetical protein VHR66_30560, partial [Gemmataceae bacterium]|nr:hypothetical protein [Gemmataceae bacterium]